MPNSSSPVQSNLVDIGYLQVQTLSEENQSPIQDARVAISYTGQADSIIETLETDSSGQTETIALETPPLEYSETPGSPQPYSEYTLSITAPGFEPLTISGTEILPTTNAIQVARLRPLRDAIGDSETVVIGPHTLYYQYPPKIAEAEIKPIRDTGSIVLNRVVVPEFIVVHDGVPTDNSVQNYYVPFRDYIKNVASSEIYATWPRSTITANVLAILSFTLNRVYTEWYRNQGYNFTITSSTAYDHKWIFERNIYENISVIVDEIFNNYLSRPDVKQPILTQYCDGRNSQCPGWMTQWGSKALGDQGYSPIEILRYYYGDDMYINTAEQIAGVPLSWPGSPLDIGSSGADVRGIQEQLNAIASVYTAIPSLVPDGIFGENTQNSVRTFQSIFGLPQTGIVDFATWYRISAIYVAVTGIAELS